MIYLSENSNKMAKYFLISLLLSIAFTITCSADESKQLESKWPTVFIAVLVRNKAHALPYFLTGLYNLEYPRDRLCVWMYSDHNQDQSVEIIQKWAALHEVEYNGVNITVEANNGFLHSDEEQSTHWSPGHFKQVIKLREEALTLSKAKWADFLFMLDSDVLVTYPRTLKALVEKGVGIVSPMLISDGLYSNFWCGMTENFYYKRTDEYKPILQRKNKGCFSVPMIHTAVLINLNTKSSDLLTYVPGNVKGYNGPEDDIIAFAVNAKQSGITLNICNDHIYGFVPVPLEDKEDPAHDYEQLLNVKLEAISRSQPLPIEPSMEPYVTYPTTWKFNCDAIYMINLERRVERRELMERSFKELGMEVKHFKAVDGRDLDINDLEKFSLKIMPNYEDPFHKRPMKAGEIGCFLSHYLIWKEVVEKNYEITLVLEDDIHFVPYFRHKFYILLEDMKNLDWDLVYIGRKILLDSDEVYATPNMVKPLYSYWTLGYLLSQRGARKLLDADPLNKILPVDEFLPIMFDQHPNATWKAHFPNRNLNAFSAAPLLVHPTHYTGQVGYISDTEDSTVVTEKTCREEL